MTILWKQPLRFSGVLAFALAVLLSGCGGGNTGTVTGKVRYKGNPVTAGTVTFIGANDTVKTSQIDSDGGYSINEIAAGPVEISVTPPPISSAPPGRKMSPDKMGGPADKAVTAAPAVGKRIPIPKRYADHKTSGLTYTVTVGTQPFDIELK